MILNNRKEAGEMLAERLMQFRGQNIVIYALPRGGIVLGAEIAKALDAPLDLIVPRKIAHPYLPEYGIAAITEYGEMVKNEWETDHVDPIWFKRETLKELREAKRRHEHYNKKTPIAATEKIAILVDDGVATGLSMEAAIATIRKQHPKKTIVAVPVIPKNTAERIKREVDELIALEIPEKFLGGVSMYYTEFPQLSEKEIVKLMKL